jgi:hypothetical protein
MELNRKTANTGVVGRWFKSGAVWLPLGRCNATALRFPSSVILFVEGWSKEIKTMVCGFAAVKRV